MIPVKILKKERKPKGSHFRTQGKGTKNDERF